MSFDVVPQIGTGLALAAFVAALATKLLRRKLIERENLIRSAPEDSRARLVEQALEWFNVDTSTLNQDQRFTLAMRQIQGRERRLAAITRAVLVIALASGLLAAFAISTSRADGEAAEHDVTLAIWPATPGASGAKFNVYVDGRRVGSLDNRLEPQTLSLGRLQAGLHEFHFDQLAGYNIDSAGNATQYVQNLSCRGGFRVGRDGVYRASIIYLGGYEPQCQIVD